MSLVRRTERLKLQANTLDRAGIACLVVGVLGPNAGEQAMAHPYALTFAWLGAALVLHVSAHYALGGLR